VSYTDRVVAYVTRDRDGKRELLVFDHRDFPEAGTQVPAGRLESGEDLEAGLIRELHEEAGLDDVRIVRRIGEFDGDELGHGVGYRNHAYEVAAPSAPDAWEHEVFGDGDDAGLVFVYRWEPISRELKLWEGTDPLLERLAY
jgi:8-oxo-dGTP pyrophosphatase MutT (NUDIX family)